MTGKPWRKKQKPFVSRYRGAYKFKVTSASLFQTWREGKPDKKTTYRWHYRRTGTWWTLLFGTDLLY